MTIRARVAMAGCLALSVAACGAAPERWTDTPFDRTTADAASTFSIAAELLERAHTGSATSSYLRGSFHVFAEQIDGLDTELTGLEGAPDEAAIGNLIASYGPAKAAINDPCIRSDCDWQAQVHALRAAARAFRHRKAT